MRNIVFLISLCVVLCSINASAQWYPSATGNVGVPSNIEWLKHTQKIISGDTIDPKTASVNAGAGSIIMKTDGNVYVKKDAGNTVNWKKFLDESSNLLSYIPQATTATSGYLSYGDWNVFNGKQDAIGYTPENIANKSTSTSLGTSDTLYPSQNAVKSYVDTSVSTASSSLKSYTDAQTSSLSNYAASVYRLKTATLGEVPDVSVSGVVDGQILSYNSSTSKWIASNQASSAGGGTFIYATTNTSSVVSSYYQNSYYPQNISETLITATVTAATSPVLIRTYMHDAQYGDATLVGGQWSFDYWSYVDNVSNTTNLRFVIFTRSATGTETNLFTLNGSDINATTLAEQVVQTVQPSYTVNPTDYIGVKVYAVTDSSSVRTVTYSIGGTSHYSKTGVPLIIRHNDLREIQGGGANDRQHLTTPQLRSVESIASATTNYLIKKSSTGSLTKSTISDDGYTASVATALAVGNNFITSQNYTDGSGEKDCSAFVKSSGVVAQSTPAIQGNYSCLWAITGTGTLDFSGSVANLSNTMQQASLWAKTATPSDWSVSTLIDGVEQTATSALSSTGWSQLNQIGTAAGTIGVRVRHTGSGYGAINVDDGKIEPYKSNAGTILIQGGVYHRALASTMASYSAGLLGFTLSNFAYSDDFLKLFNVVNESNITKFYAKTKLQVTNAFLDSWSSSASLILSIYKNGVVFSSGNQAGGSTYNTLISSPVYLNSGDYISFNASQSLMSNAVVELSISAQAVAPSVTYTWQDGMANWSSTSSITIGGTTTAPTKGTTDLDQVRYIRRGESAEFWYQYNQTAAGSGAAGSGDYLFSLPSGLQFASNTTFYTSVEGSGDWIAKNAIPAGSGKWTGYATYDASFYVIPYDSTRFRLGYIGGAEGVSPYSIIGVLNSSNTIFSGAASSFSLKFSAPIAGWSAYPVNFTFPVGISSDYFYDLTVTGTGWTTTRARGSVYKSGDGSYHLKGSISGDTSAVSSKDITLNGVTFKNVAGYLQPCALSSGSTEGQRAFVNPGSGIITLVRASTAASHWDVFCDIELESKPTWATMTP